MRTYTEKTYLETRTIQALTHVKCDKCEKDIGTFNLDNREYKGNIKYKRPNYSKNKTWYHCRKIQNTPYDRDRGYRTWDYDICPDCFVEFMKEFEESCGDISDNMEMHIYHTVQIEDEIEKEVENNEEEKF